MQTHMDDETEDERALRQYVSMLEAPVEDQVAYQTPAGLVRADGTPVTPASSPNPPGYAPFSPVPPFSAFVGRADGVEQRDSAVAVPLRQRRRTSSSAQSTLSYEYSPGHAYTSSAPGAAGADHDPSTMADADPPRRKVPNLNCPYIGRTAATVPLAEILKPEDIDMVIFLATHALSAQAIGHAMISGTRPAAFKGDDSELLVSRVISEVIAGEQKSQNPDELIRALLQRADANDLGPHIILRGLEFDAVPDKDQRRENSRARIEWAKFKTKFPGVDPSLKKGNRGGVNKELAVKGVQSSAVFESRIENLLGYDRDDREAEIKTMKKVLAELRRTGNPVKPTFLKRSASGYGGTVD